MLVTAGHPGYGTRPWDLERPVPLPFVPTEPFSFLAQGPGKDTAGQEKP